MLRQFLSVADANRALRTLRRLGHHDIRGWALTGGLAVEVHCLLRGGWPSLRALNDIDFIAESFGSIPETCVRYSGMAHFATLIWPTPKC